MRGLTDHQVARLGCMGALIGRYIDPLSDFELELIADVGLRFVRHCREAVITELEWPVVEAAIDAMEAAARRPMLRRVA